METWGTAGPKIHGNQPDGLSGLFFLEGTANTLPELLSVRTELFEQATRAIFRPLRTAAGVASTGSFPVPQSSTSPLESTATP
jgi:hypothetical protein